LVKALLKKHDARREEKDEGVWGRATECGDEREKKSMGGRGAERKVRDKEGVVVKDGKGGEKRVGDVKRSSGDEDLEVRGGGGDGGDGVHMVKFFIRSRGMYSKLWVGPWREGRVRGKSIKGGERQCFGYGREDREGRERVG